MYDYFYPPYIIHLNKREKTIINEIYNLFSSYKQLTIPQIYNLFVMKNIKVSIEEIFQCVQYLYVTRGRLIVDKYVENDDVYTFLDDYYSQSSFSEHYRKFIVGNSSMRILLISDIHIGSDIEDFFMINKCYEYAKMKNTDFAFLLGDLFHGIDDNTLDNNQKEEKFVKLIRSFKQYYPNFLQTYALLGNHDQDMHKLFQRRGTASFDLRGLTYYKNNFYMFPFDSLETTMADFKIHLCHRFFLNAIQREFRLNSLADIEKSWCDIRSDYDINISGHLHQGFIYTDINKYTNKEVLYISVPSLSKINNNQTCALFLDVNVFNNTIKSIVITPLKYINQSFVEDEAITWSFSNEKVLVRHLI